MDKYRLQFVSHPNHELPHFTNTWKYFQTWNSQAPTFLQFVPFARSNYILDQLSSITWRYSTNVDAEWKQKTEAELTSRGFVLPAQLCYSRRLLTFPFPFRTRKYYILRDEGSKRGMEIWSEISFDSQLSSNLLSANCVMGGELQLYLVGGRGWKACKYEIFGGRERVWYDVISRKFCEIIVQFGGIWRGRIPENGDGNS